MDESTPAPESAESPEPALELRPRKDRWKLLEQRLTKIEQTIAEWPDRATLEEQLLRRVREAAAGNGALADKFQAGLPPLKPRDEPSEPGALTPASVPPTSPPAASGWLLFDTFRELRLMTRMFRDLRYRVRWFTWLIVLLFLPLILLSEWWFPLAWIPLAGPYLDKIMCVILAFVVYKALSREARRYQATVSAIDHQTPFTTHHSPP